MIVDTCAHYCARTPTRVPETNGGDRDDDRLATELFRRFGSVESGHLSKRDYWAAHADAIWEVAVKVPARRPWGSRERTGGLDPDPLVVAAIEQSAFDDGFERGVADTLPPIRIIALAGFTGLLLGIILTVSATGALS